MNQKNKKKILAKYPQAKPATEGVKVGDVVCNNADIPGVLITEDILKRFDGHDYYFVIANVGEGYHFIADIKFS